MDAEVAADDPAAGAADERRDAAERVPRFLPPGFAAWRERARASLRAGVPPGQSWWDDAQLALAGPAPLERHASLAGHATEGPSGGAGEPPREPPRVPRAFLRLAASVACHRDPARWDLLYRVLWRLAHGERALLSVAFDPDVHRLLVLDKAVRRAAHKMTAFVRFRRAPDAGSSDDAHYIAWFEPAHHVVERTAPFFVRRFTAMRWSILTPERCVHWDGRAVSFTEGVPASAAPRDDALEELWRDYYASIFNPARLATGVMRAEMPKSYWRNLPEARLIPELARTAPARVAEMIARAAAAPQPLPLELRAAPDAPAAPRAGGAPGGTPSSAAPRAPSGRESPLDFPSWHPVHDPGVDAALRRARAVAAGSGKRIELDGVAVLPGVAGWTDPTLLAPGVFYPDDATTAEARLRHYAAHYAMVEVDATYYALPRREHAVAWARRSPDDFVFNIKANALMTGHPADVRRLPDWLRRALPRAVAGAPRLYGAQLPAELLDELWRRFLGALEPLAAAGKLGAIFLQFPRWFVPGRAAERELRDAARRLGAVRGAVEFRAPAWGDPVHADRAFALLEECGLAYTVVDAPQGTASSMPPVVRVTRPDFAVLRLHGRRVDTWEATHRFVSERYRYLYDHGQIADQARLVGTMRALMGRGMLQVAYNNNHANYATTNAVELGEALRSQRVDRRLRPRVSTAD